MEAKQKAYEQSVAHSKNKKHLQLHRCGRYTAGITLNIAFSKANKPWEKRPEEKPTREGKNVNSSKRPAKATSNVGIDTIIP